MMEAVLQRLQALTPDQLRLELIDAGLKVGPVTNTTRSIFEKRLARALLDNQTDGTSVKKQTDGSDAAEVHSGSSAAAEELQQPISEQSREEVDLEAQNSESPSVYYGVCPPLDDESVRTGSPRVFTDKTKALQAVMKLKGARFKAFTCKEDAEKFASGSCDGGASPHKASPERPHAAEWLETPDSISAEKANEFRSPRTQDLTAKLRRAVERGDEHAFRELVWSNPRFLIGSGDNPTIVQEGCRYNVLHVAAKENQAGIARLLLQTLEDPLFMRLMYPHDQELMLEQRTHYITDLYLNTPDRASNETPLHFACKFGCAEVVDVLCSHPSTDKQRRNKYEQKPSSVICERKHKSKDVKQRIMDYLEDRFYVPLLRAADNTLQPVIGAPWCPASLESWDPSYGPDQTTNSPKNPAMAIKAFCGPLSSAKAEEFHRRWKTPPRERARYFHHILKSDAERGAERVGRELAHEMGHAWSEYWDFLDCFADLSSRDGLKLLEEHLSFTDARTISADLSSTPTASESESSLNTGRRDGGSCRDLLQEFERVQLEEEEACDDGSSLSSDEYFTADEGDSRDGSCSSSGSSFRSTRSSTDGQHTRHVYIAGNSPTKLDSAVLLALNDVEVDQLSYPSVASWRNRVLSYSPEQRQSFPSASQTSRTPTPCKLNWLNVSPKLRSPRNLHQQRTLTFT